ncbi:MAG TPA: fused MFS/spermidine synthase, partial [Planctomycetota bacterium]|nr:fused MFS/spermidine synthase [Planctomycetota bacterium]
HQRENSIESRRNFYGTLCVKEFGSGDGNRTRRLVHGVILHGEQILGPEGRDEITTYYGHDSGVGLAMAQAPSPKRVGIVGLGTGTLAAYGEPGDVFRFYDINPQVIDIARRQFTFLDDSKAAIDTVLGDARLSLAREPDQHFDLLVVDAFSSDAIPVHLLTAEALAVYLRHLQPEGVIAFHVTNRFLQLAPVVGQLAERHGLEAALIVDDAVRTSLSKTDWVLVTRSRTLLQAPAIVAAATPIEPIAGLRLWTDDYNNLFQILK